MNILFGIIGIVAMLLIAFFMSNNKKAINYKTISVGLALQFFLAVFILKFEPGKLLFEYIGRFVEKILDFAKVGADFVFGPLSNSPDILKEIFGDKAFMFALNLIPALIFMMILVNILYYYGIMQRVGQKPYQMLQVHL